jgi:hypothetical protein
MILGDFGGPGIHFGGPGAHFRGPGNNFEDLGDRCDFMSVPAPNPYSLLESVLEH